MVNLHADLGSVDLPSTTFQQSCQRPSQVRRRQKRKKARENTMNNNKFEVSDCVASRKPYSRPTLDQSLQHSQQHMPPYSQVRAASSDSATVDSAKTDPSSKFLLPTMMTEHAIKSLKAVNASQESYSRGYSTHETYLPSSQQLQYDRSSCISLQPAYEDCQPVSEEEYKTIMQRLDEEARLIDAGF